MTDRSHDVTAWLQGELDTRDAAAFERALASDPGLQRQVDEERRLLAGLGALGDADWNDARPALRDRWRGVWVSAAALLLVVVLVEAWAPRAPDASPAVEDLAQLMREHEVVSLAKREVGLRAVGLVALSRAGDGAAAGELSASVDWLLSHQREDGTIERADGADHAVATVALLEASRHVAVPPDAVERAVDALRRQARRAPPPGTPAAHEAWTLQALLLARDLGHASSDLAIDALHRSLRARIPDLAAEPSLADARRLSLLPDSGGGALLDASRRLLAAVSL